MALKANRLVRSTSTSDDFVLYIKSGYATQIPSRDYLMCVSDARILVKSQLKDKRHTHEILSAEESDMLIVMYS